ncbi:sporulation-specific protein 22 [Elasticomyces elasticus]|nr:sporulation-specific protein 22 [Elasticomyces elasticus]
MAPLKSVKRDAIDRRLQQVLDFANQTSALLNDRAPLPKTLDGELDAIIKRSFPFPASLPLTGKASTLDVLGSQLWNAATNLLRDEENGGDNVRDHKARMRLLVLLRVFGFHLIDAAHHTSSRPNTDRDQRIRIFRIALKACRFSLDHGEVEMAMKVLERCSEYANAPEEDFPIVRIADATDGDETDRHGTLKNLVAEYYLLRLTYAWKTDRYDLADHFFTKLNLDEMASSPALAEKAADVFHEAARILAGKKLWEAANRWCERAVSALESCELEDLSHDAPELRLAITGIVVEGCLANSNAGLRQRAMNLIEQLESAYSMSNRMAVTLMRFQILMAVQPLQLADVDAVMAKMIRQGVLTDKSFKTIMQSIHKLRHKSSQSSLAALTDFIAARLLPDCAPADTASGQSFERLERALVTYVMFACTSSGLEAQDSLVGIRSVLDEVSRQTERGLSARATHAAQTLIWKRASSATDDFVDEWCQLLQHTMFDSAGQMNKARIGRKAIAAALARNDSNAARRAFFEMPETTQNESITRYLLFKVALHDNDHELATECLAMVTKHAEKDPTYLYACVLEAQQSQMRQIAVAALQALTERQPLGVHLPTLLRCTARLLVGELDASPQDLDRMVEPVVILFERAAKNTAVLRQGTDVQWRSEIQWWSKNTYNLSLRLCADVHPGLLVRLLNVCVHFLECWPADDGPMHQDDVRHRRLLCHFLAASALVVLGRSDESDDGLECYANARGHIANYVQQCSEWVLATGHRAAAETQRRDVLAREFELLKFDLECIMKLKQWDELDATVKVFMSFEGTDRWDSLADLLVVIHDHARSEGVLSAATAQIHELLQKCINATWKKDKDAAKMSRWLRLTYSINMQDGSPDFALKVVQQAASVAQKSEKEATKYPLDELCWLATMAFNKAVDSLNTEEAGCAAPWTDAALELARYASDNGALHKNLTLRKEAAERRMHDIGARA